ncbi:MAG TPA: VOC family protein, partial [Myxococcales bacterium]|nr:VOC family protein [Myxococcales bacterium]
EGWPRISSALFYDDAPKAIEWLGRAFGFETRIRVDGEDGAVVHSELVFGDGVIMVASASRKNFWRSPRSIGGANTQSLFVYVDDVEAHCARARAAGAKITTEPKTADYGDEYWVDRNYEAVDLEGHYWWFAQRMRTGKK